MAWTAPRTYTTGEMITAAILNVHVRDNQTAIDGHLHSGSAGDGNKNMSALHLTIPFTATPGAPVSPNVIFYGSADEGLIRDATGVHIISKTDHAHAGL